jgi:hypothetical protein
MRGRQFTRPMPMLLTIEWFRVKFAEAREGPITAFYGNFQCGYPPNAHAAA